jgi:hypothetical protein
MQSSQNRLALDRNDALNSAVSNERDLGVFFYWAPKHIRQRFSYLVNSGLKGSGDYGVIGGGVYNGQTANNVELNSEPHMVGRISYPFELKNKQIIEAGIQGYYGKTVIPVTSLSTVSGRTTKVNSNRNYDDRISTTYSTLSYGINYETTQLANTIHTINQFFTITSNQQANEISLLKNNMEMLTSNLSIALAKLLELTS